MPITNLSEDDVLSAVDSLRAKSLVRQVMLSGSRVEKYKHTMRDTLSLSTSELAVIAELLLRGPQTVGELRGASVADPHAGVARRREQRPRAPRLARAADGSIGRPRPRIAGDPFCAVAVS